MKLDADSGVYHKQVEHHAPASYVSTMHQHYAPAPCTSASIMANDTHQATYFIRKGDYQTSLKFISQAVALCRSQPCHSKTSKHF